MTPSTITIENLDPKLLERLRVEADRRGTDVSHLIADLVRQAVGGPEEQLQPDGATTGAATRFLDKWAGVLKGCDIEGWEDERIEHLQRKHG